MKVTRRGYEGQHGSHTTAYTRANSTRGSTRLTVKSDSMLALFLNWTAAITGHIYLPIMSHNLAVL